MSNDRVERILDATYACLVRHGVRKTTMEDIATQAGMSRPAVYQYVRNKNDAFRRLAQRIFSDALVQARAEAAVNGTLTQRLDRILAVKLGVTERLYRDSAHAAEFFGPANAVSADVDLAFVAELGDLLTATIVTAADDAGLALAEGHAREVAELALALSRGLESELTSPQPVESDRPRERLRNGVALLVAGLAAVSRPPAQAATFAAAAPSGS